MNVCKGGQLLLLNFEHFEFDSIQCVHLVIRGMDGVQGNGLAPFGPQ